MQFKKVPPRPNFPEIEKRILDFWEKNKIFEKTVEKPAPFGDFVFYEGPPTANGKPGVHHIEARAFKDLFPRYKTMQGYRVKRRAGWDTHGLPVELEVEKILGFSGKQDIEKYGIAKFNKKCAESVWKYKTEWEELTRRIGYWLDLDNPYITCSNEYISAVWGILKKIWQKKLLYQGHKVLPYCPRCGTALSSHEVAQGYKRVEEESAYIKFKVLSPRLIRLGRKSAKFKVGGAIFFLAWTTTPWTLPGNVALALGGEISYVLVKAGIKLKVENVSPRLIRLGREKLKTTIKNEKIEEEYLILARERLEILDRDYEIIQEFKGRDLEGMEYEPLYPVFREEKKQHPNTYHTVLADFVTTEEGTGIVHTAVMYGEDDYELGKKIGLPMRHTVNLQGKFKIVQSAQPKADPPGAEKFKVQSCSSKFKIFLEKIDGRFVKDAEGEIVADLAKRGLLYKSEMFTHDYPFCWRCKTPLLYYAKQSWFVAMSKLREQLVENNEKVNWIPAYLKHGRFGKWISEARDWAISRERYWGTPLPIWICEKCGEVKVVGSIRELKMKNEKLKTTIQNEKCQIASQFGAKNEESFDLHRPDIDKITFQCEKCGGVMQRVPEVLDCWFDSGAMPFASAPVQSSKFKVQSLELFPADFICEAVDQTRGWFYTLLAISTALDCGPAYRNVISLGHVLDEKGQKMSKSRGNVIDPFQALNDYGADSIRWFFYTVNKPQESKNFDPKILREIISRFILTLWNSYAFFVTYADIDKPCVGAGFSRPCGADNILDRWILSCFASLNKKVVQHLDKYNVLQAAKEIEKFVDDLSNWHIRRSRRRFWKNENDEDKQAGYETLHFVLVNLTKILAPFTPFLAEEIYQGLTGEKSVHLAEFPQLDSEYIDQDLMQQMEKVRIIVALGLKLRAKAGIKVRQPLAQSKVQSSKFKVTDKKLLDLIKEEVNVKKVAIVKKMKKEKDWIISEEGDLKVALRVKLTQELKREGLGRDLVRAIQEGRKKAGLKVTDRIILAITSEDAEIQKAIKEWREYIMKETLAEKTLDKMEKADWQEKVKMGDEEAVIGIRKKNFQF